MIAAILVFSGAYAQSDLPVNVQLDLLRTKIIQAVKADDSKTVLSTIDDYRRLAVEVPPPILFEEAKVAHRTGDALRAYGALTSFLRVASHDSSDYHSALDLYADYKAAAQPALDAKVKVDQTRAQADQARKEEEANALRGQIVAAKTQCEETKQRGAAFLSCAKAKSGLFSGWKACAAQFPEFKPVDAFGIQKAEDECGNQLSNLCGNWKLGERPDECRSVIRCETDACWYEGKQPCNRQCFVGGY